MKLRRTIRALEFLLLLGVFIGFASNPVQANPHPGQSVNVVIIGGAALDLAVPCTGFGPEANNMGTTFGGCLPVNGSAGELGDFTFTPMHPSNVSAINLTPFDTAVLNVASTAMACSAGTLTAAQKADLVAFVGGGKKLIIFDSECPPVDYSWMPFPFNTSNPGALGQPGVLTIVEENTLSSNNSLDPHFINAGFLGPNTDAVGDMNVMTTFDPNWCIDMSGTNAIGVTGPVHTYAKTGTDVGLFIYNGLDQDFQGFSIGEANLRKIWVQELQQPFNPSNLPCGVTVVGITLAPPSDSNMVGEDHTVTATLTDLLGNPQPGILVNFNVISGPNAGAAGSDTTDASGQASFTYTGTGGTGIDEIQACFTNQAGQVICSQIVTKEWIAPKGSISGMKFNDLNGNGIKDMGEPGLENWEITLTMPDGSMVTTMTLTDGSYTFTGLVDGTYMVGETMQAGWLQTMPPMPGTYSVDIAGGNNVIDIDFGNQRMPPEAACIETVNPSGKNVPVAGANPKSGQNPDGFYQLLAMDVLDPYPQIYVKDDGSGMIFGAFANGINIKYTQDPDAVPEQKTIGGPNSAVAWHIIGTGDALVYAVNDAGVKSTEVLCKVPPPPK